MLDYFFNLEGEFKIRDRVEQFDILGVSVIFKDKYGGRKR